MIFVDYRNVSLAAAHVELKGQEPLTGHFIVNTLRLLNRKFGREYGRMVLCNDLGSWRYQVFEHYKAKRRHGTKDTGYEVMIELLDELFDDIGEMTNWTCVRVKGAEADDIMAYLSTNVNDDVSTGLDLDTNKNLVISSDKDMAQLTLEGVDVYNPLKRKMVTSTRNELLELICRGDNIDGIPNILSPDDVLVTKGVRQKPFLKKYFDVIKQAPAPIEGIETLEVKGVTNNEIVANFKRNYRLIHLGCIPVVVRQAIHDEFDKVHVKNENVDLLGLFGKYQVKNMIGNISDFN